MNVNVALNRPTFMSSAWYDIWLGNDGNNNPLAAAGSCVCTNTEADPWWAVDLGAALAVLGVLFTNRADGVGNVSRLHYYFPVLRSQ